MSWPRQRGRRAPVSGGEKILEPLHRKRTVALPVGPAWDQAPKMFFCSFWQRRGKQMGGKCQPAPDQSAGIARRTVLVVEDEVLLRMAVSAHLRDAGFAVVEAVDADEAIELLRADPSIQFVFSDVMMPGAIDGNQLATLIGERYPAIRVLLTSGVAQRNARAFIAKPYSFRELQRRIEAMLPA
jgi:two-component system, response regulator PdtaR